MCLLDGLLIQFQVTNFDWNVELVIPERVHRYQFAVGWVCQIEYLGMRYDAAFDADIAHFKDFAIGRATR